MKKFNGRFYICREYEKEYPAVGPFVFSASSGPVFTSSYTSYSFPIPTSASYTVPATSPKPRYRIIDGKKQISIQSSVRDSQPSPREYYYGNTSVHTCYAPSGKVELISTLITKSLTNIIKWEF